MYHLTKVHIPTKSAECVNIHHYFEDRTVQFNVLQLKYMYLHTYLTLVFFE